MASINELKKLLKAYFEDKENFLVFYYLLGGILGAIIASLTSVFIVVVWLVATFFFSVRKFKKEKYNDQ